MSKKPEFEIDINDKDQMQDLYEKCYPCGSGPMIMMRIVTALLESIAKDKGYDLIPPR